MRPRRKQRNCSKSIAKDCFRRRAPEFQAGIAAYQNNRQDFQALLTSFLDVLHLDEEYWQNIAERETALARLEELTDCHCARKERRR